MLNGNNIGERVRNRRKELNMTQEDLAKRMGLTSKAAVSDVENSRNNIGLNRIEAYAKALSCSPIDLMGWTIPTEGYTDEEGALIEAFRKADDETKRFVAYTLKMGGKSSDNRPKSIWKVANPSNGES